MSDFSCPVVEVPEIKKHPGADKLGLVTIQGTTCIVKLGEFSPGDTAIFVPLDAIVPTNDERFAFLNSKENPKDYVRVKAIRLRGIFSDGLLVKNVENWPLNQDVSSQLGITKFEEEGHLGKGKNLYFPKKMTLWTRIKKWFVRVWRRILGKPLREDHKKHQSELLLSSGNTAPYYDLEHYKKYGNGAFEDHEEVVVTEKIHGTNCAVVSENGQIYVKSRNLYKQEDSNCLYWGTIKKYGIDLAMKNLPGYILYGEIYGWVQDLRYGHKPQETSFCAFDLYSISEDRFLDYEDFIEKCTQLGIPMVPVVHKGQFHPDLVEKLTNDRKYQYSLIDGKTIKEGVVIRPIKERINPYTNKRNVLKFVSQSYLLREGGTEHH